jgi:spermidine synthase
MIGSKPMMNGNEGAWYERETIPHILIGEDQGRRALIVDGAVQSVAPEDGHRGSGYWAAMIPAVRPRQVLLLGLGAGTVAHLLTRRFGPVPILAVDNDLEVVETARREFALDLENLRVEISDAFAYVGSTDARYDLILVDLYTGPCPAPGMISRPFLRALRRILVPSGEVVFNCFQGYLTERRMTIVRSVFRVMAVVPAGSNRILFCR